MAVLQIFTVCLIGTIPVTISSPKSYLIKTKDKLNVAGANTNVKRSDYQQWSGSSCSTTSGVECIFPFTYNGIKYDGCTKVDSDKPWCATKTGKNGEALSEYFGFCADSCISGRSGGCTRRKIRKSADKFSKAEQNRFIRALNGIISSGRYREIASYHGMPYMCNRNQDGPGTEGACCKPHGEKSCTNGCTKIEYFLTWHRLFVYQMEQALQEIDPDVTIPYWDWTRSSSPPKWVPNTPPLPEGHSHSPQCDPPANRGPRQYRGRHREESDREGLRNKVKLAVLETNLREFSRLVDTPHIDIHVAVGCELADLRYASFDPIFYLHHSFVDYIFAFWQKLQHLRGLDIYGPRATTSTTPLEPFNRNSNPFQESKDNSQGWQTLNYEDNFCYEYDELILHDKNGVRMTPEIFLENSGEMKSKPRLSIGVQFPDTSASTSQTFRVCNRGGQCSEDTRTASTFGTDTISDRIAQDYSDDYEEDYEDLVEDNIQPEIKMIDISDMKIEGKSIVNQYKDLIVNVTEYSSGTAILPLNLTFQPFVIYQPGTKTTRLDDESGSDAMVINVENGTRLQEKIFSKPPFKVDFHIGKEIVTETFNYQQQSYEVPLTKQKVTFGHEQSYTCEGAKGNEIADSECGNAVTVVQSQKKGFFMSGKKLDTSKPLKHHQGKELFIVWCSGKTNMVEFPSKEAYSTCNTKGLDQTPRVGPISYAVNTHKLGKLYLGSGYKSQCKRGRKLIVEITKEHVKTKKSQTKTKTKIYN